MRSLRFKKIDAFASHLSAGNPAAVVYLDSSEEITSGEMLQIAQELQGYVSEVGYVCPGTETDFRLRYFSAEREVAFCGHATIAILNDIVANDSAMQQKPTLSIATQNDILMVENRYAAEKSVYISAPAPRFSQKEINVADIASAMSCPEDAFDMSRKMQVINAGLETLVVPMASLHAILEVAPDLHILNQFCRQCRVDIIIVYTDQTSVAGSRCRTRVFAPTFGYLEDPATGSGNAALGYYLLHNNMWRGERISIEQNGSHDTPNVVQLMARGDGPDETRVWFGGGAEIKIEGHYLLA